MEKFKRFRIPKSEYYETHKNPRMRKVCGGKTLKMLSEAPPYESGSLHPPGRRRCQRIRNSAPRFTQ